MRPFGLGAWTPLGIDGQRGRTAAESKSRGSCLSHTEHAEREGQCQGGWLVPSTGLLLSSSWEILEDVLLSPSPLPQPGLVLFYLSRNFFLPSYLSNIEVFVLSST